MAAFLRRDRVCSQGHRAVLMRLQTHSRRISDARANAEGTLGARIERRQRFKALAYDFASLAGGVVSTWPSFTGSLSPGLNDVRTVPSLPSRR
jgi:hypothetical protein